VAEYFQPDAVQADAFHVDSRGPDVPTVDATAYGAVPNNESFDNGTAFFNAAKAATKNGTVILPAGVWHLYTYPTWTGAFPTVQADPRAFIDFHLGCGYFGTVSAAAMQNFLAWNSKLACEYAWTLEGLGATG